MDNLTKLLATKINESGLKKSEIVRRSGVSRSNLYKILTGNTENIGIETAKDICNAIGLDFYKLTGKEAGIKIPVLGIVPAGIPLDAIEDILDYEEISPAMARSGDYFALKVKGNSMLPKILEGDVLIVRKQDDANSGDICVVMVNGNDATVKKIQKEADGIRLIPNNPEFDTVFYTNKQIEDLPVKVIGRAVEIRRGL